MADEKKATNEEIRNEELTDEQTNEAAGGGNGKDDFTCAYCGKSYTGAVSLSLGGRVCCALCFAKSQSYRVDRKGPKIDS